MEDPCGTHNGGMCKGESAMTQTTNRQALVWSKKPPTTGAREEARRVRQLGKIAFKKESK